MRSLATREGRTGPAMRPSFPDFLSLPLLHFLLSSSSLLSPYLFFLFFSLLLLLLTHIRCATSPPLPLPCAASLSHLPHNLQCPHHTHARFSAAASALSPLAHAFLALFLQPLPPLEPAFQLQCSRKVGMQPSRLLCSTEHRVEDDASFDTGYTVGRSRGRPFDLAVGSPLHTIHEFGLEIGKSFQTTSQQIQNFIAFMSQQAQTAAWFTQASKMLSQGLRDSCGGKTIKYQANLERAVWDVIKNPGWVFFENHYWRNARKNRKALEKAAAKELTDSATIKTWEEIALSAPAPSPAAQPVNFDFLYTCSKCSKTGALVLCEKSECLNRYHWACSGVEKHKVDDVQYFCAT